MIKQKFLRNKLTLIKENLSKRGYFFDTKKFIFLEKKRKKLQIKVEKLQSEKKIISKKIGFLKHNSEDFSFFFNKVNKLNKSLIHIKDELKELQNCILNINLNLPNILDNTVPYGKNSNDNIEIMRWGRIPKFNFPVRDHIFLGKTLNGLDFLSSAKISGSKFVVMHGKIARLYRVLGQFMLNLHIEKHGYNETYVPYLVNDNSLYGSGQLPKFKEDLFYVGTFKKKNFNKKYALIPTGETSLVNLMNNKILKENILPIKLVAKTPCFRSEGVSYGKYSNGLIRMCQFDKVELVQFVKPKKSNLYLEELTYHAERVLQLLNLPYRKVMLCSGDVSFSSGKTYDLEVWLPSKNSYCEISSCSNTFDFQSRRTKTRFIQKKDKKVKLVHILNGSGLAIGRTLVAIMENYQRHDGKISVPKVLYPYLKSDII